jgi:hypothetical protein
VAYRIVTDTIRASRTVTSTVMALAAKQRTSAQPQRSKSNTTPPLVRASRHEKMRARTRLLAALHSKDPEAIKQAKADAIKAGYSNAAVGAIGRTPSDVFLFSKLPEADQQAILRRRA